MLSKKGSGYHTLSSQNPGIAKIVLIDGGLFHLLLCFAFSA